MQKVTKEALKAIIARRRAQTDQLLNQSDDEVDAYHEEGAKSGVKSKTYTAHTA